jgi:hypothetical protein
MEWVSSGKGRVGSGDLTPASARSNERWSSYSDMTSLELRCSNWKVEALQGPEPNPNAIPSVEVVLAFISADNLILVSYRSGAREVAVQYHYTIF